MENPHKKFSINVISNILAYSISLLIGFWFTPYLIRTLGVAAYGLIPLASSITLYFSLITLSINGSVGRFLTIDLQNNNYDEANITFNTAFVGLIVIAIVSLPFLLAMVIAVPYVFQIPIGSENSSKILFLLVFLSFFVTEVDACFAVSSWAKSRFDLRNIVIVISNIVRIVIVVFFFTFSKPSISYVGVGLFIAAIIGLVGDLFLWRFLTPELYVAPKQFDRARIRTLFGMGGWIIVNQIGSLLFLNIDLIVANLVLGAKIAGEYGSILIFSSLMRGLAVMVTGVFVPLVVTKYALNDLVGMTRISVQAVRLMGLAVALPIGLFCGLSEPFLQLWLGNNFGSLWLLLVLMLFHLPINLAVTPLFGIQVAMNKVKIPGIVTLVLGVGNLLLALFFTLVLKWGAYGIAAAAAIVLTLKNAIFTPIYGAYIQDRPWYTYIRVIIPGSVAALVIGIVSFGTVILISIQSWESLILVGTMITILYLVALYLFGLKIEDKSLILSFMPFHRES